MSSGVWDMVVGDKACWASDAPVRGWATTEFECITCRLSASRAD